MKQICLALSLMLTSFTVFANDQISVNVNGKIYNCSESGSDAIAGPRVVRIYCDCENLGGIRLIHMAIMSDGTTKTVSRKDLTAGMSTYYPDEIMAKCEAEKKECR